MKRRTQIEDILLVDVEDRAPWQTERLEENLVKEFEESFQKCLTSLTEEDDLYSREPESADRDIEEKLTQFTDVARCEIP